MIDLNLSPGEPTINNDLECLKQQIDILFDSRPGDLLGDKDYGTDYEYCLYNLKFDQDALKQQMETDLRRLDLLGFTPVVNVYLLKGSEREIAVIDVNLYRNGQSYNKTYKIT